MSMINETPTGMNNNFMRNEVQWTTDRTFRLVPTKAKKKLDHHTDKN